ncbi:MAG: DUF481 domain-containing protein [Planctomycetes bacterium]|nr:DUF481 domain-containing protein [Planctomycetota bacterium]
MHPFLIGLLTAIPNVDQPVAVQPVVDQPVLHGDASVTSSLTAQDAAPAAPKWTGSVSAGLTATDGNSSVTTAAVDASAERKGEKDRWTVKGFWNFAEQENAAGKSEITQRRVGASVKYDYFMSKRTFLFANGGAEYDLKAGIDLRTYIGGGVGYQFYDTETFKLSGEAGLNMFNEEFRAGGSDDYIAARLAETMGWQIRPDLKWDHSIELFPSVEDKDDIYGKMDNKLKLNLTEKMFASAQWVMSYDNTPAANDRVDNLYVLTLGWSF